MLLLLSMICALGAIASAESPTYDRFNFTVGGGLGIGKSYVSAFTGNSYHGVVGGGINFSRAFGVDAEYMYYDLSIRPSVAQAQSLNNASGNDQSVTVNGIYHVPLHGKFGAYGIFGVGFYRRSVSADKELLTPPLACQPAWSRWWGINCFNNGVDGQQTLSSFSRDAGGFNAGGGVTYRLNHLKNAKVFIEGRYHRAYHSDAQTSMIPITVGLRW